MAKKTTSKTDSERIKCSGKCGRELVVSNFYKSKSPFFPNGYVNICKKCISEMADYNDMNTIYTIMQTLDIPFFYNRWKETCEKNPQNPLGNYVRMANSGINEFGGARYKDSIFENVIEKISYNNVSEMVSSDMIKKWGNGYTIEQIRKLESFSKDMQNSYDVKTASHKDYLHKISKVSLKMDEALDNDNIGEFQKLSTVYDTLMKSAKFTAVQRSAVDDMGGFATLSEFIDKLERDGFIEPYGIKEDFDIVEATIADMKRYTKNLVLGDTSIQSMAQESLMRGLTDDDIEDDEE